MKSYELMTITKGLFTDEQVKKTSDDVSKAIEGLGGKITSSQPMGKKKFAYPIHTETEGYYDVYTFTIEELQINDLKSKLNYMDALVRYLLTITTTNVVEQETHVSTQSE